MLAKKYILIIVIILFTLLTALFLTLLNLNPAPKKSALKLKPESDFQKLMSDSELIDLGRHLFAPHCSRCHGSEAQGATIGPNLIDDYWLHGNGRLTDIATIIRDGVPERGMPAWGYVYDLKKIEGLTIYIKSSSGKIVPEAKAPQGKKINL